MATLPPDPPAFEPATPAAPPPTPRANSLLDRARRLLTQPRMEWDAIAAEPMSVAGIFRSWVVPLAAIPAVAGLIGGLLFGYGNAMFRFQPSIGYAVALAVMTYAATLGATWLLAKAIELLAPTFDARPDPVQAMKLAGFGMTAGWLAGIFLLFPPLAILGLAGLYTLYLLWIGLPAVMRPPEAKRAGYFGAILIAALILFLVLNALASRVARSFGPIGDASITVPGVGTIDTRKLDDANAKIAAAAASIERATQEGAKALVPADSLLALMPASVAGFNRTGTESASGGVGGLGGSAAKADYASGGDSFRLSVADIGAMGALASLGGALNIHSDEHRGADYEKTVTTPAGIVSEKWRAGDRHGKYARIVANRFAIEAEGTVPDIAVLKAAAESVDAAKLAALVKE